MNAYEFDYYVGYGSNTSGTSTNHGTPTPSVEQQAVQLLRELQEYLVHGPGTLVQKYALIEKRVMAFNNAD